MNIALFLFSLTFLLVQVLIKRHNHPINFFLLHLMFLSELKTDAADKNIHCQREMSFYKP